MTNKVQRLKLRFGSQYFGETQGHGGNNNCHYEDCCMKGIFRFKLFWLTTNMKKSKNTKQSLVKFNFENK
jgi:hypothetical protein